MTSKKFLTIFLEFLISLPLLVIFIGVIWQVFSRYVLSVSSTNSEELIRFSLIFLTFLAGAYCFVVNRHICLDLIEAKKSKLIYAAMKIIQALFIFLFSIFVLIYGGLYIAIGQYHQTSSSFNVSMFYIYLIMPISGTIICIYSLVKIYQLFIKRS